MGVNKTDVISELGVRTQKGRNIDASPKAHKNGIKTTKRDAKGLGVDPGVKTPTKNNRCAKIISDFQASNRYR